MFQPGNAMFRQCSASAVMRTSMRTEFPAKPAMREPGDDSDDGAPNPFGEPAGAPPRAETARRAPAGRGYGSSHPLAEESNDEERLSVEEGGDMPAGPGDFT